MVVPPYCVPLVLTGLVALLTLTACGGGGASGPGESGASASAPKVNSVTATSDPIWLEGTSQVVTAEVDADTGASTAVTWTSSDSSVVRVDDAQAGRMTAVAQGSATLTAASVQNPQRAATLGVQVVGYDPIDLSRFSNFSIGQFAFAANGGIVLAGNDELSVENASNFRLALLGPQGDTLWDYTDDSDRVFRDVTITQQNHIVAVGSVRPTNGKRLAAAWVFEQGEAGKPPQEFRTAYEIECPPPDNGPSIGPQYLAVAALPGAGAVIGGGIPNCSSDVLGTLLPPDGGNTDWTVSEPHIVPQEPPTTGWDIIDLHAMNAEYVVAAIDESTNGGDGRFDHQMWIAQHAAGSDSELAKFGTRDSRNDGSIERMVRGGLSVSTTDEAPPLVAEAWTATLHDGTGKPRINPFIVDSFTANIKLFHVEPDGATTLKYGSPYTVQTPDGQNAAETTVVRVAFADADTLIVAGNTKTQLGDNASEWPNSGSGYLLSLKLDGTRNQLTRNWIQPLDNEVVEMAIDSFGRIAVLTNNTNNFETLALLEGDTISFHPVAGPSAASN